MVTPAEERYKRESAEARRKLGRAFLVFFRGLAHGAVLSYPDLRTLLPDLARLGDVAFETDEEHAEWLRYKTQYHEFFVRAGLAGAPPAAEFEQVANVLQGHAIADFLAAEHADEEAKRAKAGDFWFDDSPGTRWLYDVDQQLWGLRSSVSPRPKPHDDLRAAGLTPDEQAIAELYNFVRESTYETLYGKPLPATYTPELKELDKEVARAYLYILSANGSFKEAFRTYSLSQQDPAKIPPDQRSPLFRAAMSSFSRALVQRRDAITEQVFYTNPINPTLAGTMAARDAAHDAPPPQTPTTAPDTGVLGQPSQIADQLRARDPAVEGKVAMFAENGLSGLPALAAFIRNPSFNANQARAWDALYGTTALSDWYAFYIGSPGFVSDTQSPQRVREMVSQALTRLAGVLSPEQRAQFEKSAPALADMWRAEMEKLGPGTRGFASQSRFDDWLVSNVDRVTPKLDMEIANDKLEINIAKKSLTPLQTQLLDMGLSVNAVKSMSDILARRPNETFRDYAARLQGHIEQLIDVGRVAFGHDPVKWAAFRKKYMGTRGEGEVLGDIQVGEVLRTLLPNLDPILWDMFTTAAGGNDELAQFARDALTTTDPDVLRAAIRRFGRLREMRASGPLAGGTISFNLADDPQAAELPTEFLDALRAHALSQTSGLPEGIRDIAVDQLMGNAPRYYAAFSRAEKLRLAALPEAQQPFGGVPRDEFAQIVAGTESMRNIEWADPRIQAEEQVKIIAERGLDNISQGDPNDIVTVDGAQRRRQDVLNEIGEAARKRTLARQRALVAAGGPSELTDERGVTRRTPLGNLQSFLGQAGQLGDQRTAVENARKRFTGTSAAQFAPKFLSGFGLVARRRADSIIPEFDLEVGAPAPGAAPSQRFQTSTFTPRRRA